MNHPLMSRVEEAGTAWARKRLEHFGMHDELPISSIEDIAEQSWAASAQFLLTELAEEGHGPRVWLAPSTMISSEHEEKEFSHARVFTKPDVKPSEDPAFREIPYVPLSELLAARAAHALEASKGPLELARRIEEQRVEIVAERTARESAEARVRVLTEALQWIAEQPNRLGEKADSAPRYVQVCWVKADQALSSEEQR